MKAGFGILICLLASFCSIAQKDSINRWSFGLRAGLSRQILNGKDFSNTTLNNDFFWAFQGGLELEAPLGRGFFIQTGLLYAMKGFDNTDFNIRLEYLEVPAHLLYKTRAGHGLLHVGAGPYVSRAINGTLKTENSSEKIDFDSEFQPFGLVTNFRREDGGLDFLAGYEFKEGISFQLKAQLGTARINRQDFYYPNDHSRWQHSGWGFSLGYHF